MSVKEQADKIYRHVTDIIGNDAIPLNSDDNPELKKLLNPERDLTFLDPRRGGTGPATTNLDIAAFRNNPHQFGSGRLCLMSHITSYMKANPDWSFTHAFSYVAKNYTEVYKAYKAECTIKL